MLETFRFSDGSELVDLSLISYNRNTRELAFAGARRKAMLIREGELSLLKGDLFPVGGLNLEISKTFTHQQLTLQPGDMIYLGSDGYQDQFGGPKGKKMTAKRLHEFILDISSYELRFQKILLLQYFNEWKGELPQIDDVCLMGIRF